MNEHEYIRDTETPKGESIIDTAGGALSEFCRSAYYSAVERPVSSINQLITGQEVEARPHAELNAVQQTAALAGHAAGEILDFMLLNKICASTGMKGIATSGTVGFVNGALLTPTGKDESAWCRLANGAVQAGSFAAIGAINEKFGRQFENNILGRAKLNALSGAVGGMVDGVLDPVSHGKAPDLSHIAANTFSWTIGSMVAGEALHTTGKGIEALRSLVVPKRVPLEFTSMRELAEKGEMEKLKANLDRYYPELEKAFPLPGEIEAKETYIQYLTDPSSTWEMEILKGKNGEVKGGLQYQILDVNGDQLKRAGWLEHIWVKDGKRNQGFGSRMLEHVKKQVSDKGGDLTFWEFNNPDKMSAAELEADAKGGITTQDRVAYWAKRGSHILRNGKNGEIAPYEQPGMDGQEAVPYLSLAFSRPQGLDGMTMSKSDYRKLLLAAHNTIVDVAADPTVKHYSSLLDNMTSDSLHFGKLSDYTVERAAGANFERRLRWLDHSTKPKQILQLEGDRIQPGLPVVPANANPQVELAMMNQQLSRSPWSGWRPQTFDSLVGKGETDVVVIGGGIVGLQTAHELSSKGIKTVLLEKSKIGDGAGRFMCGMGTYCEDAGWLGMYNAHGAEGFGKRLNALRQARSNVRGLARQYRADWQDANTYALSYEASNTGLLDEMKLLHEFGDKSPYCVKDAAASRIFAPARSALIYPGEGNLNPFKFSMGIAKSGKFTVFENSPVLGIAVGEPGAGVNVFTPEGMIQARKVVFATNGTPAPFAYLNEHMEPVQCFATLVDIGRKLPGNYFDTGADSFTYWRQPNLRNHPPGETYVGGAARFLNRESATDNPPMLTERIEQLFGVTPRRQPATAVINSVYSDGLPIAGPHPKYPDVWIATGAGGTGLVNGNLIATTIRQQLKAPDRFENLISPERFQ